MSQVPGTELIKPWGFLETRECLLLFTVRPCDHTRVYANEAIYGGALIYPWDDAGHQKVVVIRGLELSAPPTNLWVGAEDRRMSSKNP